MQVHLTMEEVIQFQCEQNRRIMDMVELQSRAHHLEVALKQSQELVKQGEAHVREKRELECQLKQALEMRKKEVPSERVLVNLMQAAKDSNKVRCIQAIRELAGMSLISAKELVEKVIPKATPPIPKDLPVVLPTFPEEPWSAPIPVSLCESYQEVQAMKSECPDTPPTLRSNK